MVQSEVELLRAISGRSGREFRQVRFKDNRVRLLSVSRDGATLYLHISFRTAPREVVEAIGAFLGAEPGSNGAMRAAARLRSWAATPVDPGSSSSSAGRDDGAAESHALCSPRPTHPPRPGHCCGTPAQRRFLAELYREFNRTYCGDRLPAALPLRFSARMRRRLGHFRYHRTETGERAMVEIALNIDLMAEGSERQLRDTLLHEMAHAEAWLIHGERGHGAHWRRIARRLGCVPRACTTAPVALRPQGSPPSRRIPPRHLV